MRAWQFGKPKTPGFGISAEFYISVLSPARILPPLIALINPEGEGGAVNGFGVPLDANAAKDSITSPIERGAYAFASKDRKTVLKLFVMSTLEAGFDPAAFARSPLAVGAEPELLKRMATTIYLCQLKYESHDPMVYPAVDFLLDVSTRLSSLSGGVIADPLSERYLLPEKAVWPERADPKIDARNLVDVKLRETPNGLHAYTRGMRKFNLPEFEINGLRDGDETLSARLLMTLCQRCLVGKLAKENERLGVFVLASGGFDNRLWQGADVFELRPPADMESSEALRILSDYLR